MADITQTLLLADIDAVSRTVYTTVSISPGANKLILCLVSASDQGFAGPIQALSITGAGLTWVKVGEVQFDTEAGPRRTIAVFRALGPSPSPGVLTITMDGPANVGQWVIAEFDNIDTGGADGADAIVQFAVNQNDASDTIAATLAAFGHANNATVGNFANGGSNGSWTQGSGFTEIADISNLAQGCSMSFRPDNSLTVDSTYSLSGGICALGIELKNADQGVPPPPLAPGVDRPFFVAGNLIT